MTSFKNSIRRRVHKERAQPSSRKKFGLLEKHKDYVVRAKAYHQKEETIRRLKEKAEFRNPDEFYFKMIRSKVVVDGVHRSKSEVNTYTIEEEVWMESQGKEYVLQKVQSEREKIEKLTASQQSYIYSADSRRSIASYRELKGSKKRLSQLERIYKEMLIKEEEHKKERERKLALSSDEIFYFTRHGKMRIMK